MLETKASADDIIRRAADDEARAQRVLDNRIYQAFSSTMARSHAYAAMERVHETVSDPRYDLVVVDTEDAILVLPKERSQDVRAVVDILKRRKDPRV